jgi:hypothetical protein
MIIGIGNFLGQSSSVGVTPDPYNPLTALDDFSPIWFDPRSEDMAILSGEIAVWYDRGNNGGNNGAENGGTNLVFGSGFRPTLQVDGDGLSYVALEDDSAALTFFNWGIQSGYYYWLGIFDYDGDASPAEGGRLFQLSTPSTVWYMPFGAADARYGVLANGGSGLGGTVVTPSGKVLCELDLRTTSGVGRVNETQTFTRAFVAQLWNSSAAMFSATTSPTTSNTFKGKCYGMIGLKNAELLTTDQLTELIEYMYEQKQLSY